VAFEFGVLQAMAWCIMPRSALPANATEVPATFGLGLTALPPLTNSTGCWRISWPWHDYARWRTRRARWISLG
jgi:hypothetical protein